MSALRVLRGPEPIEDNQKLGRTLRGGHYRVSISSQSRASHHHSNNVGGGAKGGGFAEPLVGF